MAFNKFAKAALIKPDVTFAGWDEIRHKAKETTFNTRNASKVVLEQYDPKKYLLSHCTIIASVDSETVNQPLGKMVVENFQIDRKYSDYYITTDTLKYINNNCFVAGTSILMADGTEKPIENVVVGDRVISHTGAIRKVTETFIHPFKGHLRVIRRLGDPRTLEVSAEHPFWAMTPAMTCACGCGTRLDRRNRKAAAHRFQDYVRGHGCKPRENPKPDFHWVSAGFLEKGDFLSLPRLQGEVAVEGVTPGKARLLGYYLAEGYFHKQKPYRVSEKFRTFGGDGSSVPVAVNFALNIDETDSLVFEIQRLLREEFGVGSSVQRVSEGGVVVNSQQSLELVQFFQSHATAYAKTKRVAGHVLQWPLQLQREILRGWIEGDGCVQGTAGGWVTVTSASADLISQMHVLFGRLGVFATRQTRRTVGRKRVRVANGGVRIVNDDTKVLVSYALQVGSVFAEKLLGGSFLEALYLRSRARGKATLGFRVRDDRTMFPIRSVTKKFFEGNIYNFETEVDHSYVANGVAVHNSDAWERKLLMASFRTFTGGENYVEHIQIPELSKGKIIDSAARDIGDSIYVDILVATDRKHRPLVEAISNGQLKTLSMGCFVPGTPVTMVDGTRLPIEEVTPGDMVLTAKGRPREVLNKQLRHGRWDMRRMQVVGVPGSVECTDNHPWYVLRPSKVCACGCGSALQAKDLDPVRRMFKRFKRGHDKRLLNPNGAYSIEEARRRKDTLEDIRSLKVEKVRADELCVGDYVIFPKTQIENTTDPGTGKARLLGYFLAEGSFLKTKGDPSAVEFNFSMDEKDTFVTEVVELLQTEFTGCSPWVQERTDRNTCVVHVSGAEIAAWFRTHGGEYSHLKKISSEAMGWSIESHRHLLGTWLNGDGHRHASGHAVGTTTSYALATQLHLLAIRCGLPVWLDTVFGGQVVEITEAVVGGVARRHEETGKLAVFNIYFPQASAQDLHDVTVKAPAPRSKKRHLRAFEDKIIFPISSIESYAYEGWVVDLEIEEDHSFQVYGFGVSNCQVQFTLCTKCGNVAYDETQLCPHVKYFKGSDFYDSFGKKRKVAELCGHVDSEPGSVRFIEASWVANPAFTGAVLRNILSPEDVANLNGKLSIAFSEPARTSAGVAMAKAARLQVPDHVRRILADEGGDFGTDPQEAETPKEEKKPEADPLSKAVDDLATAMRDHVTEKIRGEITKDDVPKADLDENRENESLIKSAMRSLEWREISKSVLATTGNTAFAKKIIAGLILHKSGGWARVVKVGSFTGRELLAVARQIDLMTKRATKAGESRIYRTVLAVNGMAPYKDTEGYLVACRRVLGRELTSEERVALTDLGRLYDLGS